MKPQIIVLTFILLFVLSGTAFTQGVAINTVGADPDDSAMLDISATNKGVLIPRLTNLQRDAIDVTGNPESLLIFNTDRKCFEFYANGSWHGMGCFECGKSVTFTYNGATVTYGTVEIDYGGGDVKCWMDRNLGATQVATSSTDAASFGDLFQWGRLDDGHQIRTSGTTTTLSGTDTPGHGNFIANGSSPYDWRDDNNDNRWNATPMVNNPCPSGWRVPTETEWNNERLSWTGGNNATGAIGSPLKLPLAGSRSSSNGSLLSVGAIGRYWSRTVSTTISRGLYFVSSNANMSTSSRALGFSVRCIKDN